MTDDAEAARLRYALNQMIAVMVRCETVLTNMALENEGAIWRRWPINHEPLRGDARNLLPLINNAFEVSRSALGGIIKQ